MPCTAISEGPCSAGRKANPSRHQPGILCHPCQQGCRETEHPQAHSLLPPRTGSKTASAAGSAGGAMGQGEWRQQRPFKRIDGKADRGNKDSRTVLSGPGVWYTGPWSVREYMQCANPTRKSPGERPRRWHRMYCLCPLHSAPHPCQRTASHGHGVRVEDSAAAKGGAQDPGSCGVLFQRKV